MFDTADYRIHIPATFVQLSGSGLIRPKGKESPQMVDSSLSQSCSLLQRSPELTSATRAFRA